MYLHTYPRHGFGTKQTKMILYKDSIRFFSRVSYWSEVKYEVTALKKKQEKQSV